MSRWEEHREREREFKADVFYEAWRAGINPDRAVACASDCYWDGKTPGECVDDHIRSMHRRRDPEDILFDPDAI
jgi:hypothetical protein